MGTMEWASKVENNSWGVVDSGYAIREYYGKYVQCTMVAEWKDLVA